MPPKQSAPPSNGGIPAQSVEPQATAGAAETPTATPTPSASGTPAPTARMTPSMSLPGTAASARGRGRPTATPKFSGRRSATERQKLAEAEAKKKAAEAKAAADAAKKDAREAKRYGYRGNDRGRGATRGRGRGGHMGDRERFITGETSGAFGAGQVGADPKAAYARRFGSGGGGGGFSGASGSGGGGGSGSGGGGASGSGIKREPGMAGDYSGVRTLKTEDGGYISSDDEDADPTMPKQDIDQLQVIDLTGDDAAPKRKDAFAPVRLTRVPHKDRTIGLSAEDAVAVDSSDSAELPQTEKKKGKQREKDLEITGFKDNTRPAAYSSSSETENEPHIKPEPMDDDHQIRPTTPIPVEGDGSTAVPIEDPPSSPETRRKAKEKIKATADALDDPDDSDAPLPEPPKFQTQAELDEWKRHYKDLKDVRNELGRQVPKSAATTADADGDLAMAESSLKGLSLEKAKTQEMHRSENVYLFQFPPVLPSLVPVSVKPDPEAERNDEDAMDVDQEQEKKTAGPLHLPSGHVGKLRIHKSGKATLDWGGTPYVLTMGADATFLQNVLIAEIPETKPIPDAPTNAQEAAEAARIKKEEEEKEKEREGGEPEVGLALGMGQVRGKFVLTPDWGQIL